MRVYLLLIYCLLFQLTVAQDTIFYNYNGKVARFAGEASTCKIIKKDSLDAEKVCVKEYAMSGVLISETNYYPYKQRKLNGISRKYYPTGFIQWEANYKGGKLNGFVKCYWKNAVVKRDDIYEEDKLVTGKCFTKTGADTTYFPFKRNAEFPGGINKLYEYLENSVIYPSDAERANKQGEVVVSFLVDYDGTISEIAIKTRVYPSLDQEALRVVKNMPKWIPGMVDDEVIRSRTNLPIVFKKGESQKGKLLFRR
jgi:TonB family protein